MLRDQRKTLDITGRCSRSHAGVSLDIIVGTLAPEQVSSPDPRHIDNHDHDDSGDRPSGVVCNVMEYVMLLRSVRVM